MGRVMKRFLVRLSCLMVVVLVWSCAPADKAEYLDKYAKFMDKVSSEYTTYTNEKWAAVEEKFNLFKGEYYEMFKSELTATEKLTIVGHEMKFAYYKVLDGAKDYIDSLAQDPEIKAKIDKFNGVIDSLANDPEVQRGMKELEEYFNGGFSRDMDKLGSSLESFGGELEENLDDLDKSLESFGDEALKVFEDMGGDAEKIFEDVATQFEDFFDGK